MKKKWKEILEKWFAVYSQEEKEYKEKSKNRSSLVYLCIGLLVVGEIGALYFNSGYQEGLNEQADIYKEAAKTEGEIEPIIAGNIYDRNGVCLVENTTETVVIKKEVNGETIEEEQVQRVSKYADDYADTQLLGFTGKQQVNLVLDTETEDKDDVCVEIQSSNKDYRLMKYYKDTLYATTNINSTKGNNLVLTLDHELQVKVLELLKKELEIEEDGNTLGFGKIGSAIVMDAKTGEILAMVSLPSLNANTPNESLATLYNPEYEDLELGYPIATKGSAVPGSIFKIVTATALLDHGMEDFTAQDTSFFIGDKEIVNDYGSRETVLNYKQAFQISSNVFFAKSVLEMGGEALDETAKKFGLDEELELDFGTIQMNWDLDMNNKGEMADTAYGQGKTLFSTVAAARVVQTIANDGVMEEPRLVRQITSAEGEVIDNGKEYVSSEVTSKKTADKVTDIMLMASEHYCSILSEKDQETIRKYSIAAKTGTGEINDKENNAWFCSFAPADDPKYVVVLNQCSTTKYGASLADTAMGIYRYLFE